MKRSIKQVGKKSVMGTRSKGTSFHKYFTLIGHICMVVRNRRADQNVDVTITERLFVYCEQFNIESNIWKHSKQTHMETKLWSVLE